MLHNSKLTFELIDMNFLFFFNVLLLILRPNTIRLSRRIVRIG